jgi:AAA15 family ATPase/GTPase
MLIRFVVTNFLSFNEESEFNMIAGSFKTHKDHVYSSGKIDVLKAAVIYGANASGKSNLIKAIRFLQETVRDGGIAQPVDDKKFKLNKNNSKKPVSFEIEFSIRNKVYSYGISLNHLEVTEEWLYESGITAEDKLIFERKLTETGETTIRMADKYVKTQKEITLIEIIKENLLQKEKLLLGLNNYLKIDDIKSVHDWFVTKLIVIFPGTEFSGILPLLLSSSELKRHYDLLLQSFDTGISQLSSAQIDFDKYEIDPKEKLTRKEIETQMKTAPLMINNESNSVIIKENGKLVVKKAISFHKDNLGNNVPFMISEESDGTKRLLDFIPAFYNLLQQDFTYLIDEIDRSLHPSLLCAIICKIMADQTTKGQLIFTSHESNLLDLNIFRQDEIWFVEKDNKLGDSKMYSLSEFKPRYDLNIRKGYLTGRFGAIPFLANLQDLNWDNYGS